MLKKNFNRKVSSKKKRFFRFHRCNYFYFFRGKFFSQRIHKFSLVKKRHICILVDRVGISASKLQKHGAYQVETSVSTQLTPPNFDRGGVYYVGSMPIHHALQVSALLREGMFRGYL